jgi:hypothetical protein
LLLIEINLQYTYWRLLSIISSILMNCCFVSFFAYNVGGYMAKQQDQLAKSRLGRLLINRGYISESQLDEALQMQSDQNMMLGEVLIAQGWITSKELKRTLKHQSRYRYTAAFVALVAAPFQPMVAMAASPLTLPIAAQASTNTELSTKQMGTFGGMQMLDDEELAGVNAQGFGAMPIGMAMGFGQNADAVAAGFQHKYQDNDEFEEQDDEQVAYELADTVLTMAGLGPIGNMIDADITIEGLKYQEGRAPIEILEGGKMKFYMPTEIARISMENMRVKGNTSGPTLGDIYMSDIKYHPDSNYIVSAKN